MKRAVLPKCAAKIAEFFAAIKFPDLGVTSAAESGQSKALSPDHKILSGAELWLCNAINSQLNLSCQSTTLEAPVKILKRQN